MAQFKVTVKTTSVTNGVRLEKGMSVNVVCNNSASPFVTEQDRQAIADAFTRAYGIDIKKTNRISNAFLDVEKVK